MRTIILLILLVSSCQNEQKISILEKELNILFDAKNNERDEKYKERFDSLLQVCLNDSNSFTYPFHDLKRNGKFNIIQSSDKNYGYIVMKILEELFEILRIESLPFLTVMFID